MSFWQRLKEFLGPRYSKEKDPPRELPDLYYKPKYIDIPPEAYNPPPPSEADRYPREMPRLDSVSAEISNDDSWVEGNAIVSINSGSTEKGFRRIGINYEDAKGELSDRVISVAQLRAAETPNDHSMIIAFCHNAGAIRHFRVDRIKGFFDPETGEVLKSAKLEADASVFRIPQREIKNEYYFLATTLEELKKETQAEIEKLGWFLELEDLGFQGRLACYRMAKRGNRRLKHPSIELYHEPFFMDPICTPGGDVVSYRKGSQRSKPWGVRASEETTRTFSSLGKAATVFFQTAKVHAPTPLPPTK